MFNFHGKPFFGVIIACLGRDNDFHIFRTLHASVAKPCDLVGVVPFRLWCPAIVVVTARLRVGRFHAQDGMLRLFPTPASAGTPSLVLPWPVMTLSCRANN